MHRSPTSFNHHAAREGRTPRGRACASARSHAGTLGVIRHAHHPVLLILLLAAALASAAGCADKSDDDPLRQQVEAAVVTLRQGDPDQRVQAAEALGELAHPDAIEALVEALADTQVRVRIAAVDALGAIASPAAVPGVVDALDDVNFRVRLAAVRAAERIAMRNQPSTATSPSSPTSPTSPTSPDPTAADGPPAQPELIDALAARLADDQETVRIAAGRTLALCGRDAVDRLIDAARQADVNRKPSLLFALGAARITRATALLTEAVQADAHSVRQAAAEALGSLPAPQAVPLLADLLRQPLSEADRQRFDAARSAEPQGPAREQLIARLARAEARSLFAFGAPLPETRQNQRRRLTEEAQRLRAVIGDPPDRVELDAILADRIGQSRVDALSPPVRRRMHDQLIAEIRGMTTPPVVAGRAQPLTDTQLLEVQQVAFARIARRWWPSLSQAEQRRRLAEAVAGPVDRQRRAAVDAVRIAAADALVQIGADAAAEALVDVALTGEDAAASAAIDALRSMGSVAIGPVINALRSKAGEAARDRTRRLAMVLSTSTSDEAAKAIIDLLTASDQSLRHDAAAALLASPAPIPERRLVRLANHEDAVVRAAAVDVLGRRGAASPAVRNAVFDAVDDADAQVRLAAVRHAARFDDPAVVGKLIDRLRREKLPRAGASSDEADDPDAQVHVQIVTIAIKALARLQADDAASHIRRFIDPRADVMTGIRLAAVEAVGRLGDRRAVDALTRLTEADERRVRYAAILALGRIADPRALGRLKALAEKPSVPIEHSPTDAALEALGMFDHHDAASALVAVIASRRSTHDKRLAARGLTHQPDEAVAPLAELLRSTDDQDVRFMAAELLGNLGRPGANVLLDVLGANTNTDDAQAAPPTTPPATSPDMALAALHGLSRIGQPELIADARPTVIAQLQHASSPVRAAAAWTLGELADPAAEPALRQRLADEADPAVRSAIDVALRRVQPVDLPQPSRPAED